VQVVVGEQAEGGELLAAQQMPEIGLRVARADEAGALRVQGGEIPAEAGVGPVRRLRRRDFIYIIGREIIWNLKYNLKFN